MAILLECSGKHVGIRSRPNQTLTRYGFGKKRKWSMISDSKFDNESKLDPSINVSLYHYLMPILIKNTNISMILIDIFF